MPDAADHHRLTETLRDAQRLGFFGDRPIEEAIDHSRAFVVAVRSAGFESSCPSRLVDLGSGGGLPGLVLADELPDTAIVLIDRRQKRTDFLERAVSRLGCTNVSVRCDDVAALIDDVEAERCGRFDVVTARGFGPPETTLRASVSLLESGGVVVISEPPSGDRWSPVLLDELDLTGERVGAVRVFRPR